VAGQFIHWPLRQLRLLRSFLLLLLSLRALRWMETTRNACSAVYQLETNIRTFY